MQTVELSKAMAGRASVRQSSPRCTAISSRVDRQRKQTFQRGFVFLVKGVSFGVTFEVKRVRLDTQQTLRTQVSAAHGVHTRSVV